MLRSDFLGEMRDECGRGILGRSFPRFLRRSWQSLGLRNSMEYVRFYREILLFLKEMLLFNVL